MNNGKIVTLSSPTKANATFQGWYSNSTYTNQVVT
ncbi:InlB B-repeat-containing protein [bacterium]|nr:InlB B-repeat-containing protein [bacterium]